LIVPDAPNHPLEPALAGGAPASAAARGALTRLAVFAVAVVVGFVIFASQRWDAWVGNAAIQTTNDAYKQARQRRVRGAPFPVCDLPEIWVARVECLVRKLRWPEAFEELLDIVWARDRFHRAAVRRGSLFIRPRFAAPDSPETLE
jgi:hypothetical protein